MMLTRKILLLFFLFSSIIAMGQQGYVYSYIDPCTSKAKEIFIDTSNGSVPLTYNGQIHSFTTAELQSGAFQAWIDSVNNQNPSGPCSGVGLAQNTTINVMVAQNNISVITSVMSTLSTMTSMQDIASNSGIGEETTNTMNPDGLTNASGNSDTINSTTEDVTSIGGSSVQGVIQADEKVSSNNDKDNKQNNGNNSTNSNNGNNSIGSSSNSNGNSSTSNTHGSQNINNSTSGSAGNQGSINSITSGPTTTGNQTSQSNVTNNGQSNSNSIVSNGSSGQYNSNSIVSNRSSGQYNSNSVTNNGGSYITNNGQSNTTSNINNSTTPNSNSQSNNQTISSTSVNGNQNQGIVDNSSNGGGVSNVIGSIGSVKTDNSQQSESDDAKAAADKALSNAATTSSTTKSKVAGAKKGNLMMNGDLVTIASATGDPSQFKFNASIISSNTKNTFAKGALINYTSYINNSNVTLFISYRHKKLTSIFANSMMINFQKDFFDTFSLMESYKYHKITGTIGANLTIGNIGTSKFQSLSILGGVFTTFKINPKIGLTTMFVSVYSPYVYYYQGMWYQSGTLLVPFTAVDYKITKKFKLNISFSAVEQVNDKAISYQILTGAKCLL